MWKLDECDGQHIHPHEHWALWTPLVSVFLSQDDQCPRVAGFEPDDPDHYASPWTAHVFYQGLDGPDVVEAETRDECAAAAVTVVRRLLTESTVVIGSVLALSESATGT